MEDFKLTPEIIKEIKDYNWLGVTDIEWKKQNTDKKLYEGFWLEDNQEYLKWRASMAQSYQVYKNDF